MSEVSGGQSKYLKGLDGLRAIAILLVIAYHSGGLLEVALGVHSPSPVQLGVSAGWMGVTLFFVISGLLITGILLDARRSRNYFRTFYARRFLRIFPLYYVALAILLVLLPMFNLAWLPATTEPAQHWLSLVLFVPNIDMAVRQGYLSIYLDPTWSLGVEEQFYLTWPLMVLWLGPRRLAWLCAVLIGGALVWRGLLVLHGARFEGVYFSTPSHMDALAVGALLAVWLRGDGGFRAESLSRVLWGCAGIAAATLTGIAMATGTLSNSTRPMQVLGLSAVVILSAALVAATLRAESRTYLLRVLEFPVLRSIGKYSYAMYLFHELAVTFMVRFLGSNGVGDWLVAHTNTAVPLVCTYVGAVLLTYCLAWCSWHILEKRGLSLKRLFVYAANSASPGMTGPTVNARTSLPMLAPRAQ